MTVYIGGVVTWDTGLTPREQVEKMGEEVMEVFHEVLSTDMAAEILGPEVDEYVAEEMTYCRGRIVDECADVITATCNLLELLGVTDMREAMERCAERQRERGRL